MRWLQPILAALVLVVLFEGADGGTLRGVVVDARDGRPVPARIYLQNQEGEWFHVESDAVSGRAIPYEVRRGPESVEVHTSLSPHPFRAELPDGSYRLTAVRGKEYCEAVREVQVTGDAGEPVRLELRRWASMNERGWFSGDTHVHRTLDEMPLLLLSEDLNVGLPLTAWVTDTSEVPAGEGVSPQAELIEVDSAHVIWPLNTEYEIFTVDGRDHALGAVFVLNHKRPLELPALPVARLAEVAREQGAILDLDKHNWPWSAMLVPQMRVGLFELTNNHLWRTKFLFGQWYPETIPDYMGIERSGEGYTEEGWIKFGFQTYYALLNCGFDIMPSAGTANGVHPVPLGFGRVYVKLEGEFSYDSWIKGLEEGRSFVTNGPMLEFEVRRSEESLVLRGEASSPHPLGPVEIVVNGEVVRQVGAAIEREGVHRIEFNERLPLEESCWVAARVFEKREDGRPRFAHSAPRHFELGERPVRPTREQRDYLLKRVKEELNRNRGVLPAEALEEYESAIRFYGSLEVE